MLGFLNMMGDYEQRKVANTKVSGGCVDTVRVTDSLQPYETGIEHPAYNNGTWVIVELYPTKEAAMAGHLKWVEHMKTNPAYLDDVNETEIQQFVEAFGGTCRGRYPRKEPQPS